MNKKWYTYSMAVLKRVPFQNKIFYIENAPTEEGKFDTRVTKTLVEKTPSRLNEEEHLMKVVYRYDPDWCTDIDGWSPSPGIIEGF